MEQPLVHAMCCRPLERFNHPTANVWKKEHKATALVITLRGTALEILQTLSKENRNTYSTLTTDLEFRFGDEHLKNVFAAQAKTRIQKAGESLQELEADVKRLVRLAYSDTRPSCSITSSKENHTTEISSTKYTGKLKTASTLGDVLAGKTKDPREVKIGSFTKGSSPTIPGKINGTCVQSRSILALKSQSCVEDS